MSQKCDLCGLPEEDHHPFVPQQPTGCICNAETWVPNEISPICETFEGEKGQYCNTCEHEEGCHGQPARPK